MLINRLNARNALERKIALKSNKKIKDELKIVFDTRTANCLASIGIRSLDQVRQKVLEDGISWLDKVPRLGKVSKIKVLKSINYNYNKPTN